jgi:hypothetical protein
VSGALTKPTVVPLLNGWQRNPRPATGLTVKRQHVHRLRGSVKMLSALISASVVVAMGAVTVLTPPLSAPETSLAAPTVTANPWQGRR